MLDFLFAQYFTSAIDATSVIITMLVSFALGGISALVYNFTHRESINKAGFSLTLMILPVIISIIIMLIGNNIARAFSVAGAFSIIRYRSIPGEPLDIAYAFFALAVGLGCGIGYLGYSVIFAVFLSAILLAEHLIKQINPKNMHMQLKIIVPENLSCNELFDEVLAKYTKSYKLIRIKSTDFGTVFEVTYRIMLAEETDQKEFIDSLRVLNGNLNISLSMAEINPTYEG